LSIGDAANAYKKNDTVKVIAGREIGKTGKVLNVVREKNRVVIEKVNLIKNTSGPMRAEKVE